MTVIPIRTPDVDCRAARAWGEIRVSIGSLVIEVTSPDAASRRDPPLQRRVRKSRRLRQRGLGFGEGPVEPWRQRLDVARLDGRAAPDAQARRRVAVDRRCRRRRLPSPAGRPCVLTKAAWASAGSRVTAGSTTFRHTEVLERSPDRSRDDSIHGVRATQSASALALASERATVRLQAADRFRPLQRVEIVLDAQHRRRVDGLALENAFVELAALGHAENLRQRPGRLVAFEPLDRARRQDRACRARPRRPAPSARRRSRHRASANRASARTRPRWRRRW